ncbi:Nucleoside 2-deoxyribosyltransferase [Novymonas esmeraldas]|uniref:Nucleoside 2-deoxyribosyltransferase n=1 Tax=Novymonas esmeraldas TaxID=1808958 RepID=A0AAW0EXQ5_9TRYP
MSTPKKIYIAGPAVFHADHGEAYYAKARALLAAKGVVPLIPTDNVVTGALNIRNKNIEMIKACDAIIADLSPFRSKEPDCGTAFEVGYGAALDKVLLTFSTDTRSMVDRYGGETAEGLSVENFGLPFNLMLHDGTDVFDSFEAAFAYYVDHHLSP